MTRFQHQRRTLVGAGLAGSIALLAGCSVTGIINELVPTSTFRGTFDTAYGSHDRHRLDVYQPKPMQGTAPVVVFFYGGNWNTGNRADYLFVGEALAARGCVAVIPDYRLYPEVRYPDFLHDSAQAVRWVKEHIAEFGGDPQRIFVMGHSAGAYNAAMLALNPVYLQAAGTDLSTIRGLIGLAGPYDFLPLTGDIAKAVFGFPDTAITTQPIHYASASAPPVLLVTGTADDVVDPGNSTRLAAQLHAQGACARTIAYPGLGHRTLVGALAAPLRGLAPVLDDVAGFVNMPQPEPA